MNYLQTSNNHLGFSQFRSTTNNDLFGSRVINQLHSLPPISQPILTQYRVNKSQNKVVIEQTTSFWCKLFNTRSSFSITLCKCQRTQDGHCQLVMKWINEYYDWKKDNRFVKAYRSYNRRNIELFLADSDIRRRLEKKLQILGVRLSEKYIEMLVRISKNFLKHTIYYGKSQQLTRQNDLWMWFLIGIFYHIGGGLKQQETTNLEEQIIFWSLDIIMNHFGNLTRNDFQVHIKKIIDFIRQFFGKSYEKLVFHYHIDLQAIVYEWTNQFMMGYMDIDSIAFFMDCLLKKGWIYLSKIVLSYFEKRIQKMQNDELFQTVNEKQVIMRQLLNCDEQWPLIFCNANTFCLQTQQSTQP